MDVELLAGERTGEKPERYDENLGQIPPLMLRVWLQSFIFHSQKASMRLSSRASAQRERGICFSSESKASEGSAFRWRAKQRICFSSFERLSQQQIPRYARVQRAALGMTTSPTPFERETRRT